jgi:hypothetical protein
VDQAKGFLGLVRKKIFFECGLENLLFYDVLMNRNKGRGGGDYKNSYRKNSCFTSLKSDREPETPPKYLIRITSTL